MPLSPAFAMLLVAAPPGPASAPAAAPVRDCREAADAYYSRTSVAGAVDGGRIGGRDGLLALRAARGSAVIVVIGGDLSRVDLSGAKLGNICFFETKLAGSDWRGAETAGLSFIRVDLTGARLGGAKMRNVHFWSVDLTDVDASRADLSGGTLSGNVFGSLLRLRLDGADLTGFRFACGITQENNCGSREGVSFRGANLTSASVAYFLYDADWTGARLDRTEIRPEQLLELGPARVHGPLLVRGGDLMNGDTSIASLSPAEYGRLRPHLRKVGESPAGDRREAGARPPWLRPGARALFVRPRIELDDVARAGPLYARLLPVLISGARAHVGVRVHADGSIDARGDAVGGNGHLCDVGGDRLRLDPATGWYSGPHVPFEGSPPNGSIPAFPADPPAWRDRPMPVLRFRGDRVEVYEPRRSAAGADDPRMSHYVMCGARAGFDEMLLVPSDSSARQLNARFALLLLTPRHVSKNCGGCSKSVRCRETSNVFPLRQAS